MLRRKTDQPRGILKTPVADQQRYRHERYHPSPDLELYVEHFWVVEWDLRGQAPERAETLPHPNVHMIFERDGKSRLRGPARAKFSTVLEDKGGVFAVKFTPAGFYSFVRVPVSQFSNTITTLYEVFGTDGDDLDHSVLSESIDQLRANRIEEFLRARGPEPDENVRLITEIVYSVAKDRAILKVEDLVHRYHLKKRMLQRLFEKYVGVSPKWVIQRYRLHEAAEQLGNGTVPNYADLALTLGYSDQAHFVRDFRALIGLSPAAYVKAARQNY